MGYTITDPTTGKSVNHASDDREVALDFAADFLNADRDVLRTQQY